MPLRVGESLTGLRLPIGIIIVGTQGRLPRYVSGNRCGNKNVQRLHGKAQGHWAFRRLETKKTGVEHAARRPIRRTRKPRDITALELSTDKGFFQEPKCSPGYTRIRRDWRSWASWFPQNPASFLSHLMPGCNLRPRRCKQPTAYGQSVVYLDPKFIRVFDLIFYA